MNNFYIHPQQYVALYNYHHETECDVNATELMESVVSFVQSFGLHRPEQTPCGQPVPVAEAHALMDLAAFGPMRQAG